MATKFYLAEIPDDFPATNVKFENMTKPLLAIPPKMVDGKPITIVGYIDAGQKKYKANDYGFVEFNDNGADFAQFKDANMDTRYSVSEKVSGDILGYLPLETGELVGIVLTNNKGGSGTYTGTIPVNVKGDIGEGQSVTVTSTAPIMKCSGSKNVTASFTGTPKKSWTRVETSGQGTTDNYGLSAVLTPGVWEGTATFSCALA